MREIKRRGYRIRLDLSTQVLGLAIEPDSAGESREDDRAGEVEAKVHSSLTEIMEEGFVSASVLAQKAKQFDDGLYATIELAAQGGAGRYAGKARLLGRLTEALARQDLPGLGPAPLVIFTAARLGNLPIDVPSSVEAEVRAAAESFFSDRLESKPIAFYTWTRELREIFQQDRMLQAELRGVAGIEALANSLHADPLARSLYETQLDLASRLTNPLAHPDLRGGLAALDHGTWEAPAGGLHFFPPSISHETELAKRLLGDAPPPDAFSLIDEMIARVRAGELNLVPTSASGWYDYQTWALEPLILHEKNPESKHLKLDASYRKQLLELFKGTLALTQETHAKQLELAKALACPDRDLPVTIDIYPELTAEPLATYYLRRARSYQFVSGVLERIFGGEALATLHRLTAAGSVEENLKDELAGMEALFLGAHAVVCEELGISRAEVIGREEAGATGVSADHFRAWSKGIGKDPDVGRDPRMMVPVFFDPARGKTKVWAMLGWSQQFLRVHFATPPKAEVMPSFVQRFRSANPELEFGSRSFRLPCPATAEVYVEQVLDRDEFRRHCDTYRTRSAILANLK